MYDFLIVGSGLFGAAFAHKAFKAGKKVLVVEKRSHIGGNIYTENIEGINVHKYGAHIFHTDNKEVWDYVNSLAEFNNYVNSPVANYKGEIYNMPFNMNTFSKMWNIATPKQAQEIIEAQKKEIKGEPSNLEEQAISLVGRDVYEKLVKGYTEKQWGKSCSELPSFIIRRLPVRYTYDNNYFNDRYQGIPMGGYTAIIEKMLEGAEVRLNTDFLRNKDELCALADKVIYTGMIDEYFDYCLGHLEYRSLKFESKVMDEQNYQGNAVVNYTDSDTAFTRVIEHKHFEFGKQDKTVVTWEYPKKWEIGDEPYYAVNDNRNNELYSRYAELAEKEEKIYFGGRLGSYKYYDMDDVIIEAWKAWDKLK